MCPFVAFPELSISSEGSFELRVFREGALEFLIDHPRAQGRVPEVLSECRDCALDRPECAAI